MEKNQKVDEQTTLIIGLGNVGKEYDNTRHNAGFTLVDELQQRWGTSDWKEDKALKAFISKGNFNDQKVILAKPTTFMNLSGEAVSKVMGYYKISLSSTWIVYDDLDLPLGKIRIKDSGSAGTHNGMKSILTHIASNTFPRIRIGIESRGEELPYGIPAQMDTSTFVLNKITSKEALTFSEAVDKAKKAIELSLTENIQAAMNKWN